MIALLKRIFRDITTTRNGKDFCPVRIGGLAGLVVFLALACWTVVAQRHAFDGQSYGTGLGLVLAGMGAGAGLKVKDERSIDEATGDQ